MQKSRMKVAIIELKIQWCDDELNYQKKFREFLRKSHKHCPGTGDKPYQQKVCSIYHGESWEVIYTAFEQTKRAGIR